MLGVNVLLNLAESTLCAGKRKWPGSNKTMEGSVSSFAAQIIAVMMVMLFTGDRSLILGASLSVALFCGTFYEGVTMQSDNLIVPLVVWVIASASILSAHP